MEERDLALHQGCDEVSKYKGMVKSGALEASQSLFNAALFWHFFMGKDRKKQNDKDAPDPTDPKYLCVGCTPPSLLHFQNILCDSFSDWVRKTRPL